LKVRGRCRWPRFASSGTAPPIARALALEPVDDLPNQNSNGCGGGRSDAAARWAGVPVTDVASTVGTSIRMIQKHYKQFIPNNELADKLAAVDIV
jgi:hypothetical protein